MGNERWHDAEERVPDALAVGHVKTDEPPDLEYA